MESKKDYGRKRLLSSRKREEMLMRRKMRLGVIKRQTAEEETFEVFFNLSSTESESSTYEPKKFKSIKDMYYPSQQQNLFDNRNNSNPDSNTDENVETSSDVTPQNSSNSQSSQTYRNDRPIFPGPSLSQSSSSSLDTDDDKNTKQKTVDRIFKNVITRRAGLASPENTTDDDTVVISDSDNISINRGYWTDSDESKNSNDSKHSHETDTDQPKVSSNTDSINKINKHKNVHRGVEDSSESPSRKQPRRENYDNNYSSSFENLSDCDESEMPYNNQNINEPNQTDDIRNSRRARFENYKRNLIDRNNPPVQLYNEGRYEMNRINEVRRINEVQTVQNNEINECTNNVEVQAGKSSESEANEEKNKINQVNDTTQRQQINSFHTCPHCTNNPQNCQCQKIQQISQNNRNEIFPVPVVEGGTVFSPQYNNGVIQVNPQRASNFRDSQTPSNNSKSSGASQNDKTQNNSMAIFRNSVILTNDGRSTVPPQCYYQENQNDNNQQNFSNRQRFYGTNQVNEARHLERIENRYAEVLRNTHACSETGNSTVSTTSINNSSYQSSLIKQAKESVVVSDSDEPDLKRRDEDSVQITQLRNMLKRNGVTTTMVNRPVKFFTPVTIRHDKRRPINLPNSCIDPDRLWSYPYRPEPNPNYQSDNLSNLDQINHDEFEERASTTQNTHEINSENTQDLRAPAPNNCATTAQENVDNRNDGDLDYVLYLTRVFSNNAVVKQNVQQLRPSAVHFSSNRSEEFQAAQQYSLQRGQLTVRRCWSHEQYAQILRQFAQRPTENDTNNDRGHGFSQISQKLRIGHENFEYQQSWSTTFEHHGENSDQSFVYITLFAPYVGRRVNGRIYRHGSFRNLIISIRNDFMIPFPIIRLTYQGELLKPHQTPHMLGMQDGDVISIEFCDAIESQKDDNLSGSNN